LFACVQLHFERNLKGYYIYGAKRLVLRPDHESPGDLEELSLICDFNHGDDERADCHLVTEGSHHECAEMHLTLKHRDTHHTQQRGKDRDDRDVDHRGEIVEHHYDIEGHDHAEHFDRQHRHIDHPDDDNYII